MAIPSGAGTEVLKSVWGEDVDDTEWVAITGVQYHIYIVTGFTVCNTDTSNDTFTVNLFGRDSGENAANGQYIGILRDVLLSTKETFTWNEKLVFHGYGSNSGAQSLRFQGISGSQFDIQVSYIDQDWT